MTEEKNNFTGKDSSVDKINGKYNSYTCSNGECKYSFRFLVADRFFTIPFDQTKNTIVKFHIKEPSSIFQRQGKTVVRITKELIEKVDKIFT